MHSLLMRVDMSMKPWRFASRSGVILKLYMMCTGWLKGTCNTETQSRILLIYTPYFEKSFWWTNTDSSYNTNIGFSTRRTMNRYVYEIPVTRNQVHIVMDQQLDGLKVVIFDRLRGKNGRSASECVYLSANIIGWHEDRQGSNNKI